MSRFRQILEEMGDAAAAAKFGVSVRTIRSWRLAEREPRPEQARHIVRRMRGRVSFGDIYAREEHAWLKWCSYSSSPDQ